MQEVNTNSASAVLRPRRQRQYTDKRRQYCKLAARERRSSEADVLQDLGRILPISQSTVKSLDKLSILRLAVTALKLSKLFGNEGTCNKAMRPSSSGYPDDPDELLNGEFLVVIAASGEILYVSEGVSQVLDYKSWELIGNTLYDHVHSNDKHDLEQLLAAGGTAVDEATTRSGLIRLKCNAFPHIQEKPRYGRTRCPIPIPAKTKAIHFSGKIYPDGPNSVPGKPTPVFIGTGRSLSHSHPMDNSFPLPFVSRRILTSLLCMTDMSFLRSGENVEDVLRFSQTDLGSMKATDLVHWADSQVVLPTFHDLYTKGQSKSEPFRFLVKGGGWVWIIAEASVVRTSDSTSAVFCTSFVISEVETNEIVSVAQMSLQQEPQAQSEGSFPFDGAYAADPFVMEDIQDPPNFVKMLMPPQTHTLGDAECQTLETRIKQYESNESELSLELLATLSEDMALDPDTLSTFSQAIDGLF